MTFQRRGVHHVGGIGFNVPVLDTVVVDLADTGQHAVSHNPGPATGNPVEKVHNIGAGNIRGLPAMPGAAVFQKDALILAP